MKNIKSILVLSISFFLFSACNGQAGQAVSSSADKPNAELVSAPAALKMQTLMKETLALAKNVEVITSYVEVPANTALPMHFHPGEEFAYVLEGSGALLMDGQEPKKFKAGDSAMVPFKAHHTFKTFDKGAKLIVFRVHEKGQPERVLVDKDGN